MKSVVPTLHGVQSTPETRQQPACRIAHMTREQPPPILALILALVVLPALVAQTQERYIAVDNVCAWPNLTVLPNGDLAAAIFNRPSHGLHEGDVEVWASSDGGKLWKLRGTATSHDPGSNRMNVAAGRAHNGDLVVLASGWGGKGLRGKIMPVMISRSSDGGRTWQRSFDLELPEGLPYLIPFGDIVRMEGRMLAAPFYEEDGDWNTDARPEKRQGTAYVLFSKDDGRTWGDGAVIGSDDYNETSILRLRADRWLAALRTYVDGHLELFVSEDEGRNWRNAGPLTMPSHHPAHLMRLADGRILLTYGIREKDHQGVGRRISDDEGKTWKAPTRIVNLEASTDGGYPATVQLPDGTLVTAYYSNGVPQHRRYHMGVIRWSLDE